MFTANLGVNQTQLKDIEYSIDPTDNRTYLEDNNSNVFGFKDGNYIIMFDANENGQIQYNLQDIDTVSVKDGLCNVILTNGNVHQHTKRIENDIMDPSTIIDYQNNDLASTMKIIRQQYPSWVEDLYFDKIDERIWINSKMIGEQDRLKPYNGDESDLLSIVETLCSLTQTVTENGKSRTIRFKPIKQTVDDAVRRMAWMNQRNSFIHMVSRVKWDGIPRIDLFLSEIGCRAYNLTENYDEELYLRFVSRGIFLTVLDRSLNTEYRSIPFMPIVIGEQGTGKSQLCVKLGLDWYRSSTQTIDDDKRFYESSNGSVILELTEAVQFNNSSNEMIKAFVDKDRLQFRKSYGRNEQTIPIRFLAIATTNVDKPLTDGSGNRRFYPIYKTRDAVKQIWDFSRDEILQLWAEAYSMYQDGIRWNDDLEDESMIRIFRKMQDQVTSLIPPFDELRDFLNQNYPNVGDRISNQDLREFLQSQGWYGRDAENKIRDFSRNYASGFGFRSLKATMIDGIKSRGFERMRSPNE